MPKDVAQNVLEINNENTDEEDRIGQERDSGDTNSKSEVDRSDILKCNINCTYNLM